MYIPYARTQVERYNEGHGTELDLNKLSLALFAHDSKFNECLKKFETPNIAENTGNPTTQQKPDSNREWFGGLGGFNSEK